MSETKDERIWVIWQIIKTITVTYSAGAVIIFLSMGETMPSAVNGFMTILGILIFLSGTLLAFLKEFRSRVYYCTDCKKKFTPTVKRHGTRCPLCNSSNCQLVGRKTE